MRNRTEAKECAQTIDNKQYNQVEHLQHEIAALNAIIRNQDEELLNLYRLFNRQVMGREY